MHQLIVILGPTASGKSTLGIILAKKFQGVIISGDSRQVYRGMDLGTGKVTKKEMMGVPHYLLDVASPKSQYSVAQYVRDVIRVLKKIPPMSPIFLVGGTPFYIDALTKPDSFSSVPPNPALRQRLEKKTTVQLVALLKKKNPTRLQNIDIANRRRLIRAIEISSHQSPPGKGGAAHRAGVVELPKFRILKLGIAIDKQLLHKNIARRVESRMRQGMVREVQRLHKHGVSWNRLDALGLEYRWLSRYLRGQLTKPEAVVQLKSSIRHFAKRQMTWWKRDQEIRWVKNQSQASNLVKNHLTK